MQQQTPEPIDLSDFNQSFISGSVIRLERINYGSAPCYIVLRQLAPKSFCTHFYNASQDAFEFGTYHQDLHAANIKYFSRIEEYGGPFKP